MTGPTRTSGRRSSLAAALLAVLAAAGPVAATPSSTFWAPSTAYVQPFRVTHVTYDTYFGTEGTYPIDTGLTMGILPWKGVQAEVGFDLLYPSVSGSGAVAMPVVFNAKLGAPEDTYFKGQPGWSAGIYGVGLEEGYNDQNVLYAVAGKTFPRIGSASVGGYYGLNEDLLLSADGAEARSGLLAGWTSPPIDLPRIDKLLFAWDIQTGENVLGATGGGACVYFTPAIALLIGPVFYFEGELQPAGSESLWSVQLDVDLDFTSKKP